MNISHAVASALLMLSLGAVAAQAEIAVIINPENQNNLTEADIKNIFLGKTKAFPNGATAVPVEPREGISVRADFNDKMLSKSESQRKSYWSQLMFSGKAVPPKEVDSEEEIRALVAKNPNIIGYISTTKADGSVKVAFKQ